MAKPPLAAKIDELDLATIDEAEQKDEQNTFANGMPLGAMLMGKKKDQDTGAVVMKTREGVRSAGV